MVIGAFRTDVAGILYPVGISVRLGIGEGLMKKLIIVLGLILLCGIVSATFTLNGTAYTNQIIHQINGSSAGNVTNYPITLVLYNTSGTSSGENCYLGGSYTNANWSDVAFSQDQSNELPHWIEENTGNSTSQRVWTNMSSIANGTTNQTTLYIYFGNATKISTSNGLTTFPFFEDWDAGTFSTTKFTNLSTYSISNGLISMTNSNTNGLYSNNTYNSTTNIVRARTNQSSISTDYGMRGGFATAKSATAGYQSGFMFSSSNTVLFNINQGSHFTAVAVTNDDPANNVNFYITEEYKSGSTNYLTVWDSNSTKGTASSSADSTTTALNYIYVMTPRTGLTVYDDWVLLRPFVLPEPTHSTYVNGTTIPGASFTTNISSGYPAFMIQCNDTSTNTPTGWIWQWGDGTANTSGTQNPTHTFSNWIGNSTATYQINLTANNSAGSNLSSNQSITLYPLISNITSNVTFGVFPFDVLFNNTITNGTATTFLWNWSEGGADMTTQNGTHTYSSAGIFSVLSNISNSYSYNWTYKSNYITSITSMPPTSNFSANVSSGYPKYDVQFTDASTNAISWYWDFGDGSNSTTQSPVHSYQSWIGNSSVSYNVAHEAINSNGTAWFNATNNQTAYPLTEIFSSNVTSGKPPLNVQFNTTYGNGTATNWSWNFGDSNTSSTRNATHTYYSVGSYDVILNTSNAYSYVWSKNITMITVNTLTPPVAAFHANTTTGYTNAWFQFTDDSTNTPTSWEWSWGDSTPNGTTKNPLHQYTTAGSHNVTLTVSNADGSDTLVKNNYITITYYLLPFPGYSNIPTITPGNTLYNDVNGNGRPDFGDATTLFLQLGWAQANEPIAAFDFNHNGYLDYKDAVDLFYLNGGTP